MKKKLTVALAAAALAIVPATAAFADGHEASLTVVSTTVPAAVEGDPSVTIVHGVPGLDGVSILADGAPLLSDVDFQDIATTNVPAGTYAIAVSTSDSEDDIALGPLDLEFQADTSYAVVAHLDAAGEVTASLFSVNAGEGVSAFHTAAFPAVAIVAGGDIAADDLTNGNAAQLDLDAGTELPGVGIAAAGSTEIALPVGDLTVPEGERILAFAVGAPAPADEGGDMGGDGDEMEQPGAEHSPGEAGLASTTMPAWVIALMVAGALALAAPAAAAARARR